MNWVIYKHTNKINDKVYIGQTKQDQPEKRWGKDGIGYLSADTHFSRGIKKYGWNNFFHEIIERDIESQDLANKRETFWIKFYNSMENGYNSNLGGDSREVSSEVREKMRQNVTGEINPFSVNTILMKLNKSYENALVRK